MHSLFRTPEMPQFNSLLLERRYRGEHPVQTLFYLYRGEGFHLILATIFYVIKHSGVWAMPLLTANIIDVVSQPDKHSLMDLWVYVGILFLVFIQNIPTHYLFILQLSIATRNMESRLRSALARRLQHLSMNFYYRKSTGALQTKLLRDVEIIQQLTNNFFQTV